MTPELAEAAKAYRAERERYWVRRRIVGESTLPGGGCKSFMVTDVELADASKVFSGSEDDAKAWLDVACLRVALAALLLKPSATVAMACGGPDPLRLAGAYLLSDPAS